VDNDGLGHRIFEYVIHFLGRGVPIDRHSVTAKRRGGAASLDKGKVIAQNKRYAIAALEPKGFEAPNGTCLPLVELGIIQISFAADETLCHGDSHRLSAGFGAWGIQEFCRTVLVAHNETMAKTDEQTVIDHAGDCFERGGKCRRIGDGAQRNIDN